MASRYDPAAAPTIWRMPDDLGRACRRLLPPEKPPGTRGRPAVPVRRVLDGIPHVLRTGCRWKAVPREVGSGSTGHARFQEWVGGGVWTRLWRGQLRRDDAAHGIGWVGQCADSATGPSPPRRRRERPRPDQPGEAGHQAPRAQRPPGRAAQRRAERGQPHRHEGGRDDPRRGRRAAA